MYSDEPMTRSSSPGSLDGDASAYAQTDTTSPGTPTGSGSDSSRSAATADLDPLFFLDDDVDEPWDQEKLLAQAVAELDAESAAQLHDMRMSSTHSSWR